MCVCMKGVLCFVLDSVHTHVQVFVHVFMCTCVYVLVLSTCTVPTVCVFQYTHLSPSTVYWVCMHVSS